MFRSDAETDALRSALASLPERYDLLTAAGGRYYGIRLSGRTADTPGRMGVNIPIKSKADRLSFLLTAGCSPLPNASDHRIRIPNDPAAALLRIRYADKSEETVKLALGQNLNVWNEPFSGYHSRFAVRGVDANGDFYSFNTLDFVNPHPDKTIDHVNFTTRCYLGISPVMLALSIREPDRVFPKEKFDPEAAVKRPAGSDWLSGHIETTYDIDFAKDDFRRGHIFTTSSLKPRDVRADIVYDATAPRPGKVLRLRVPPAYRVGDGDGGRLIRVSYDLPCSFEKGTQSLTVSFKLSCLDGFNHGHDYAVDGNRYLVHNLKPDGTKWTTCAAVVPGAPRSWIKLSDLSQAKMRRISFYFREIPHPVEIRISDIGSSKQLVSSPKRWKFKTTPTAKK